MRFPWQRSEQSPVGMVPAWHPNFRNHERLPDTKVVRTFFFVNVTAITLALCLALLFGYQEYRINNLNHQAAYLLVHNSTNKKSSDEAVVLARKFADEEKKIRELDAFVKPRLVLTELLLHLGSTLPADLVIDSVDVRDAGLDLRGTAAGSPEEASDRTSAYVEQLRQDKYLGAIFESKDVRQDVKRDQLSGHLSFDLFLRFKGEARKKP